MQNHAHGDHIRLGQRVFEKVSGRRIDAIAQSSGGNMFARDGLNRRQIDEVQVFNLAATRPDLLTGVDPATGQPAPYGSVGVDINCAVIGFTATAPKTPGPPNLPGSQFPPR